MGTLNLNMKSPLCDTSRRERKGWEGERLIELKEHRLVRMCLPTPFARITARVDSMNGDDRCVRVRYRFARDQIRCLVFTKSAYCIWVANANNDVCGISIQ